MSPQARTQLDELLRGNERFRTGEPGARRYRAEDFSAFARGQNPRAALVTCSDSRIAPEIIFDQPLGSLLVARVPGNVASESVRWMLDIAVGELRVPLVLVVGHTGCRAVQQVIEDKPSARHASLQSGIFEALRIARTRRPANLLVETALENARQSARELLLHAPEVADAVAAGDTAIVAALYRVESGHIEVLTA
ncbi:MAG: Carbonic anhydrase [Phycisphaerae bacterium]|nr:Carbonic anhydrase [Phycisphaerae bacterium]